MKAALPRIEAIRNRTSQPAHALNLLLEGPVRSDQVSLPGELARMKCQICKMIPREQRLVCPLGQKAGITVAATRESLRVQSEGTLEGPAQQRRTPGAATRSEGSLSVQDMSQYIRGALTTFHIPRQEKRQSRELATPMDESPNLTREGMMLLYLPGLGRRRVAAGAVLIESDEPANSESLYLPFANSAESR